MIYCLGFKVPSFGESSLGELLDIHLLFDVIILFATFGIVDISTRKSRLGGFLCPFVDTSTVVGLGLLYAFGQQGLLGY